MGEVVKLFPGQPSAIELFQNDTNMEAMLQETGIDDRVSTMVQMMTNKIAGEFMDIGLDPENAKKEFCFVIESVVSYILAQTDKKHILQDIANHSIVIEDEDNMFFRFIEPKLTSEEYQDDDSS